MNDLVVLVPLKPFERAKSRLGSSYDDTTRTRIAESLARNLLSVARRAFPAARLHVLGEASLAPFASSLGASLVEEAATSASLGSKIDAALDALPDWGIALVVMGDLPDVTVDDLVRLASTEADVVLAEGADGHGTNAIRLVAPRRFDLAFAEPASCDLHETRALASGLVVARIRFDSLARDLDRPADLTDAEALAIERATRG